MNLIEKTRRFFEPLEGKRLLVLLSITKFTLWALYALFSVYIVRRSVQLLNMGDTEQIWMLIYEFLAFTLIYFIVSFVLRKADWPMLWHEIQRWIYKKYLEKIFYMDGNALEAIGTGRIIASITTGEKIWIDTILHILQEGTKIIIITGYLIYIIFLQSFYAGAVFIVFFILLHGLVVYINQFGIQYRKARTEKKTELTRGLVRIVMSRNEILQSGKTEENIKQILQLTNEMELANNGISKALFLIFNLVRLLGSGLRIGMLLFIVYISTNGTLSPGDVAGIFALLIVFEGFLFSSTEFYKNFTKDFVDIEKLWKTFDDTPTLKGYETGNIFIPKDGDICLKKITYGYNETIVFSDFSLDIKKGKKTALVGASGGGKTTLMKLIAGYIHPDSGNISVMGNTLSEVALKSYYPHIGYLTQDPSVFDATIRENLVSSIIHSEKGNQEDQLISALKLARCDFVFELPDGIDTEIGERGVRLSGGQKQRLAIAKIFLKNPEIILLDEPTSALDSFSEEAITGALSSLFEGRTVIIIAHRLQTVKNSDEIIVLEGGKIIERGNHDSLIEQKGIYNRMLELQSGF